MSLAKKDFFAKEVIDAIQKACDTLGVPQEELDIEVVETGSNGIFGLIRKKAHIRAAIAEMDEEDTVSEPGDVVEQAPVAKPKPKQKKAAPKTYKPASKKEKKVEEAEGAKPQGEKKKNNRSPNPPKPTEPVTEKGAEVVRQELSEMLTLMGFPSEVTVEIDGVTVRCRVSEEHEEALTAQDGKIIDSLQYLLRKLVARKVEEKIRLSIDIGQFRERRKIELVERARELAALVKEDGKTQVIPPLNPSERRIVHVALQDDNDIRSRSVGGGLFKKVLIYKPGKGKKPGSYKRGGRGKGKGSSTKKEQDTPTTDE